MHALIIRLAMVTHWSEGEIRRMPFSRVKRYFNTIPNQE